MFNGIKKLFSGNENIRLPEDKTQRIYTMEYKYSNNNGDVNDSPNESSKEYDPGVDNESFIRDDSEVAKEVVNKSEESLKNLAEYINNNFNESLIDTSVDSTLSKSLINISLATNGIDHENEEDVADVKNSWIMNVEQIENAVNNSLENSGSEKRLSLNIPDSLRKNSNISNVEMIQVMENFLQNNHEDVETEKDTDDFQDTPEQDVPELDEVAVPATITDGNLPEGAENDSEINVHINVGEVDSRDDDKELVDDDSSEPEEIVTDENEPDDSNATEDESEVIEDSPEERENQIEEVDGEASDDETSDEIVEGSYDGIRYTYPEQKINLLQKAIDGENIEIPEKEESNSVRINELDKATEKDIYISALDKMINLEVPNRTSEFYERIFILTGDSRTAMRTLGYSANEGSMYLIDLTSNKVGKSYVPDGAKLSPDMETDVLSEGFIEYDYIDFPEIVEKAENENGTVVIVGADEALHSLIENFGERSVATDLLSDKIYRSMVETKRVNVFAVSTKGYDEELLRFIERSSLTRNS